MFVCVGWGGAYHGVTACKCPCLCVLNAVLKQQHDKMAQQQAIIQQAITQQSIRGAPWQQSTAAGHAAPTQNTLLHEQLEQQRAVAIEQIQQSETNLAAQYQSIMQQQQVYTCSFVLQTLAKGFVDIDICTRVDFTYIKRYKY